MTDKHSKVVVSRRVCHACVGSPRDEHCGICDGPEQAVDMVEPVAWLISRQSDPELGSWVETESRPKSQGYTSEPLYRHAQPPAKSEPEQADDVVEAERKSLIAYGRNLGLGEASTLCSRMAYAAYYPPGTRYKTFTPKAQTALGDILIKACNEIASLPDGPHERFKAWSRKSPPGASGTPSQD